MYKHTDKFSKEKLGEFFGDEPPFNTEVLKYYLKHFSFENMFMPDAMRYYLTFIEPPGESQKIERICYEFAYRYYDDNPEVMTKEAACVYAFLLVMCHSNLYNPNVEQKNKMSLSMFSAMAAGVKKENNGVVPSQEYISASYQNIVDKPIAVHWAQKRKEFLQEALNASSKKKEELCKTEYAKILEELNSKISVISEKKKKRSGPERTYLKFTNINLIKPFLSKMWKELFAFITITIENLPAEADFNEVVNCAIGMMKQADEFDMDEERDAFILVFIQFSGLDLIENRELTDKNLYFIRTLVDLAFKHAAHIHKGWRIVLNTILKIDYYMALGAGADKRARLELKEAKARAKGGNKKDIEYWNCQQITLVVKADLINNVFINSINLDQRSISDLFESLTFIALQRLGQKDFTDIIQKIVMCIDINFNRPYAQELVIFDSISKNLVEIIKACEEKKEDTYKLFCIDSLKQIISKFLVRRDTIEQGGQAVILQPFLDLARSNLIVTIAINTGLESLAVSADQVIHMRAKDIKKGWR
jgi:Sec7-like guanine-nucleotide exchange factor